MSYVRTRTRPGDRARREIRPAAVHPPPTPLSIVDIFSATRYYYYMLEDAARKYGLLALLIALLFVICFSENGVIEYMKLKQRIGAVNASIKTLQSENVVLKGEIDRLQHDDRYLEDVAREKFGFIREGEKVYRIEK